jgi:two-component system sensor histidine kinase UhpB
MIKFINRAGVEIAEQSEQELISRPFIELIHPDDRAMAGERYLKRLKGEVLKSRYIFRIITKNDNIKWLEVGSALINFEGRPATLNVVTDITDRKQVEEELRISRSQLRALATRLQQIREEERLMVAREIHDEMGGGLTGLKMDLSWLLRKMGDADPCEERVALMEKIHTSNALIDQMIKVVRRISADLRPSVLDDLGLIAALSWQAQEFESRTEMQCEFVTSIDYINLEAETATGVFRVFQEALTNVMRHSKATKVVVVLREDERSLFGEESLVLEIRDNGRGITEEEILNPESLGLLGMKERVLAFGGELQILGDPDGGTTLILKIPRHKIPSLQA